MNWRLTRYLISLSGWAWLFTFRHGMVISCQDPIHGQIKLFIFERSTWFHIKVKVKLVTLVESDPKASFSIATTPMCRRWYHSSLDCSTLPLPYNAECLAGGICYIIAEGFRFMLLSLVRLRTFWLSTWVSWVQHWGRC